MQIVVECRCYREQDVDATERLLEKNFGKSFHYIYVHKEKCYWVCKFVVDNTTIPTILGVVKTSACTHINCYVGEE